MNTSIPTEDADCPECNGSGFSIEPECCGRMNRDGSCCCNSVPSQEACGFCGGSGSVTINAEGAAR